MVEQQLEQLGYSPRESGVYVALLRLGEASATELIRELGWHRQLVYNALDSLSRQGLISQLSRGKKMRYRAASPQKLTAKLEEQLAAATTIVPRLEALKSKSVTEQLVQVHVGFTGVRYVREDMLRSLDRGDLIMILGATPDYLQVMGDYHEDWMRRRIKQGVRYRMVTNASQAPQIITYMAGVNQLSETRVLPGEFSAPTSTAIYGDKIVIQIWEAKEPAMILIENAAVAADYRRHFDFLWKLAKE